MYILNTGEVPAQDRWRLPGGRLCPEKLQCKEQTVDELGKANTVLQAHMMIIPVRDRRLKGRRPVYQNLPQVCTW